jgi:hypothetical protein
MTDYASSHEVRRWAQAKGADVSNRGDLPKWVILAWNKANPDRPHRTGVLVHGLEATYVQFSCRCPECTHAASRASAIYKEPSL